MIPTRMMPMGRGGKRGPTARDYVQNGLVAMWDGIENAGWGVHDPNATVWTNLAGQFRYDNADTATGRNWSENALVLPGILNGDSAQYYASVRDKESGTQSAGYTLESCGRLVPQSASQLAMWPFFAALGAGGSRVIPVNGNVIKFSDMVSSDTRQLYDTTTPWIQHSATYSLVHSTGYSSRMLYVDGLSVDYKKHTYSSPTIDSMHVKIGGQFWTKGMTIHCIRLYNRALTAEEIAHNCAVDKIRFNLP